MKITINQRQIEAKEGESILQAARRNDIYIPAICYLNGCNPTLACRLCMVEADGKRVYSCNAKVKEGMQITTNSPEIAIERNAIMQTYCINHPLECGVCDKSGECELQNMTTLAGVGEQSYAIKDTHKPHQKWGLIQYDPALCIVCERCITVCADKIGENALKTTPRGGEQVSKDLKDTMPKDAHAIWTKFQKSLIAPASGNTLDCSFCGECTSVCPVGALVGAKFQYTSNAWELSRVPAANPHSSDCELLYYDVKPKGISDRMAKIYRVSNDFHFAELDACARWGYDFANEYAKKDETKFNEIVLAFKSAQIKNIKFNSQITNEEALILQMLADKFDLALINDEALAFANFLDEFKKAAGTSYNANYQSIKNASLNISVGALLRYDSTVTSYKLVNSLKVAKSSAIYFHPLQDGVISGLSKNMLAHTHKPGDELALMLFLAQKSGALELDEYYDIEDKEIITKQSKKVMVSEVKTITDENGEEKQVSQEVEKIEQYDQKEIVQVKRSKFAKKLGLDEEKFDAIFAGKDDIVLIVGADFYTHQNSLELARLAGLLQDKGGFKVMLIPPRTNSLGVANICKLSKEPKPGKTLGYNENADFKFKIHGGDIDAAALTQQEGSFTNIEQRLVPTNAALAHSGYYLEDLARALGLEIKHSIDLTSELPQEAGYESIKFDELTNFYAKDGSNHRGYELKRLSLEKSDFSKELAGLADLALKDNATWANLYLANPIEQSYQLTSFSSQLSQMASLVASQSFLDENSLNSGDVVIITDGTTKLGIKVSLDKNIKNSFAMLGDYDGKVAVDAFFKQGRYAQVQILKQGAGDE